jgi:pSer/pThr/pTyr-binding forkhead associated (FHA) protein
VPRLRFLLRRAGRDIVLTERSISVGRSSACDLVLDDPKISAEHARLRAGANGVTVMDLGSRNGVFVNGARIAREATLTASDLVAFGDTAFEIVARQVEDGDGYDSDWPTLDVALPAVLMPVGRPEDGESFRVLGAVIDKAIALRHVDQVEAAAADALDRIARELEAGKAVADEDVGLAAASAMKLTSATGRGVWINLLFRIYRAQADILPTEHIDALYGLLRHTRSVDWDLLGDYVTRLRTLGRRTTPAQRFAIKRIEGLLRLGPG